MEIIRTNGCDERFFLLCQKLDEYLDYIVGGKKQRSQYVQYNTLEDIHDVVLIVDKENLVGCGSFKRYEEEVAEIKRVFVDESYRGRKCGLAIMKELEIIAREKGYKKLILETGKPLWQAAHLYEGLGYKVINNYGPYIHMEDSICMEKLL